MKTKMAAVAIITVTAGVFAWTRPYKDVPSDFRDAVADNSGFDPRFPDFDIKNEKGNMPLPAIPERVDRNVTVNFKLIWDSCDLRFGRKVTAELRKYRVILVPGFLSNSVTRPVTIFGMPVVLGKYFGDQMETLAKLGVDYKLADIQSEQTPAFNAVIIAKEIEASAKPVILIGHSKGGLDILETLITRRKLLPKVKGIITIQTPYFGSPVADYILQRGLLGGLARRLLDSMGGTIDCLASLDTPQREAYYKKNFSAIGEVVNTVPLITFGAWKDNVDYQVDTVFEPLRNAMTGMGLKNDGQVPISSMMLPGADRVEIHGADHFVTVMATDPVLRYDRVRLTKTLLIMLLSKISAAPAAPSGS